MDETTVTQAAHAEATRLDGATLNDVALIEDEMLVEEISIDGMCGVY